MRMRHDAGYVAAEIAAFARRLARELGGDQVATVGALTLSPNLVNVVAEPGGHDGRSAQHRRSAAAGGRAAPRSPSPPRPPQPKACDLTHRSLARFEPVAFAPPLVAGSRRSRASSICQVKRLPSGAGHDAQILAAVCPACMIFVPSVGGISHNVEEYTAPDRSRRPAPTCCCGWCASWPGEPLAHPRRADRHRRRAHAALPRRRPDRRRRHRRARLGEPDGSRDRRPCHRCGRARARARLRRHPQPRRARRHGARRERPAASPASSPFSAG